jgi:hypothetical protein
METREIKEGLPGGGWHTVSRVFLEPPGARDLVCPNCGNANPEKFKTIAPSNTLEGFLCMACTAN